MYKIAVIIPCYKVKRHILQVLSMIGPEVGSIYVVDDFCPDGTGKYVEEMSKDTRIKVIYHAKNLGVGGAVKTGFSQAVDEGADILVKVDGDGQIDPKNINRLVLAIIKERADYVKGNRFFNQRGLSGMPFVRIIGNSILSFFTKLSSGYWHIMDPTNGFIAIHAKVFSALQIERIDNGFFFETDILFRLHLLGAVVQDVPIKAQYGDEKSNLKILPTIFNFSLKHLFRLVKRTVYEYFIQDFNAGSTQLVTAVLLMGAGIASGLYFWIKGIMLDRSNETGTIMIVAILLILGFQLLLGALHYDVSNKKTKPIFPYL